MPARSSFDYAVIRVVPRVERAEFLNVGVLVYCRARDFLAARIELDQARLRAFAPALDLEALDQALALFPHIAAGDARGGPIAQLPQAERFHWLVAPRSTVAQTSPVHSGLCDEPERTLEHLLATMVRLA
jgi:hypothetical protein